MYRQDESIYALIPPEEMAQKKPPMCAIARCRAMARVIELLQGSLLPRCRVRAATMRGERAMFSRLGG
jgi:hypothetical protein